MTEPRAFDADSLSSSEATSTGMTSRTAGAVPAAAVVQETAELVDRGGEETTRNGSDVADIGENSISEESEGEVGEGEEDDIEDDNDYIYDEDVEPSPVNPHALHRRHSTREPLVPLEFADCEQALQHFVQVFEERYGETHPHFYIGTLENAMKEVTDVQDPQQAQPLLIFVHSDKSVMAHLFCAEVLCKPVIVDYLNANFITWPWDITHDMNKNILLAMIDECFDEEPATDSESKDHSFAVHKPWFTQPQPRPYQRSPLWRSNAGPNVTPKSVLMQLTSNVDDLPACVMFYPVPGQPHSIQGTWVASKGGSNMLDSFLTSLMACIEDFKVLSQQQSQQTHYTGEREDRPYQQGYSDQYSHWSHAAPSHDSSHSTLATPQTDQTFGMDFSWLTNLRVVTSHPPTTHDQPADQDKPADQDQPPADQDQLAADEDFHTADQDTPTADQDKPADPDVRDNLDLSAEEQHRPVNQDTGTSVDPDQLETMVPNTTVNASDTSQDQPHSHPAQNNHPVAHATLDKE